MAISVKQVDAGHQLVGDWTDMENANKFLSHLHGRNFAAATIRAYAYDITNFARFLEPHRQSLTAVKPMDVFAWVDWQGEPDASARRRGRGAAPATINRRVAAVRALFEFLVMNEVIGSSPVPAPRRGQGLRPTARGLLGHLGGGRSRGGGRLVREARRLPESLDMAQVDVFLRALRTHRDRAMVLAMVLGGLRSAEVRGLVLKDVDMGRRRVRVLGKGSRERVVPIDRVFFAELAAYLREERPPGLCTPQCFVVLRGPTSGSPITEAGLRSLFRRHRETAATSRVRPHRLRHTYGTELASAGIDLMALRDLMGHASPETTSRYVHLSPEYLAAEYAAARATRQAHP